MALCLSLSLRSLLLLLRCYKSLWHDVLCVLLLNRILRLFVRFALLFDIVFLHFSLLLLLRFFIFIWFFYSLRAFSSLSLRYLAVSLFPPSFYVIVDDCYFFFSAAAAVAAAAAVYMIFYISSLCSVYFLSMHVSLSFFILLLPFPRCVFFSAHFVCFRVNVLCVCGGFFLLFLLISLFCIRFSPLPFHEIKNCEHKETLHNTHNHTHTLICCMLWSLALLHKTPQFFFVSICSWLPWIFVYNRKR